MVGVAGMAVGVDGEGSWAAAWVGVVCGAPELQALTSTPRSRITDKVFFIINSPRFSLWKVLLQSYRN
jgi:hypothetical protein